MVTIRIPQAKADAPVRVIFRQFVPLRAIRAAGHFFLLSHVRTYSMFGDGRQRRSSPALANEASFSRRSLMISTRTMMVDLLTVRDVARRLSISERTVWRWTALGLLPPPVHPHARSTRWRAADIERYLEELPARACQRERHE
jgi:predicted DNA-binding transcriptional regulator AlpA